MRYFLLLLILGLLFACNSESSVPTNPPRDIPFRKDGTLDFIRANGELVLTIDIEIAEDDSSRTRGLMERQSLPENSGMLFIFPFASPQAFWMANTPLSLDIMYVGADENIVSIARYTTPYSTESVPSEGPAQYVVEVPAGFCDNHGILAGDRIAWRREE